MSCSPHSFTLKCVYIVNNNPRRRAHKLTNILTRVHYPQPTRTLTRINQPDSTGSSSNAALSLSLSFTGRFCRSPSPLSRRSARVMSIAPETKSCFKITFIVFTDRKWMVKKKKKSIKKIRATSSGEILILMVFAAGAVRFYLHVLNYCMIFFRRQKTTPSPPATIITNSSRDNNAKSLRRLQSITIAN